MSVIEGAEIVSHWTPVLKEVRKCPYAAVPELKRVDWTRGPCPFDQRTMEN